MNEIWGSWFYRRPTNPPNLKEALREWLGGSYSIENDAHKQPQWQQFSIKIVNLKIPWGLWFYRCIFRKRVSVSIIITIKLMTPTLSLNSKGDSLSTSWASFARSVMQLEPAKNCCDSQIQLAILDEHVKTLLCWTLPILLKLSCMCKHSNRRTCETAWGICPWPLVYTMYHRLQCLILFWSYKLPKYDESSGKSVRAKAGSLVAKAPWKDLWETTAWCFLFC